MSRKWNRGLEFKGPNAIISQIAKIRERLNRLIVQELREHQIEGIVTSHGDILSALFKYTELSMQETADLIDRDKSTVTALVDKLIDAGFVEKRQDETDKRVAFIRLTEQGRGLQPTFQEISASLIARIYAGFTEQEKETLIILLTRIQKNMA
jgi:MarR family transcriptional regulator, organic hydroperoxide resistance regulator